jgi:hypothetical protein
MRAILINPYIKEIQEMEYAELRDVVRHMSWLDHIVTDVHLEDVGLGRHLLGVDRYRMEKSRRRYFRLNEKTFCGNGVIISSGYGDTTLSLVEIQDSVSFLGGSHV